MSTNEQLHPEQQRVHDDQTINVMVRYITATRQFVDPRAPREKTLASLKQQVLTFYGLVEDATKTYQLALGSIVQTNLSADLGALAGTAHELRFNLTEVLKQG
ncbi:MAG TPA: hypothetical protein VKC56_13665 [Gallionellaceae bacterium]|nr:hypothetical protein [Gallionellaceae bacterium]